MKPLPLHRPLKRPLQQALRGRPTLEAPGHSDAPQAPKKPSTGVLVLGVVRSDGLIEVMPLVEVTP